MAEHSEPVARESVAVHEDVAGHPDTRPIEDRSFEAVEAGAGLLVGAVVGSAVAGPLGTGVGAVVGVVAGIAAGEALERREGRAAWTTDASDETTAGDEPELD